MDTLSNYTDLLGTELAVTIDRPVGSRHPRLNFVYPVNYGFIPGTTAGDGAEIDAYILGVDVPLASFTGTCIAMIVRKDDSEHKLIVVPPSFRVSRSGINAAVSFTEKYFQTEIVLASDLRPVCPAEQRQSTDQEPNSQA